MIFAVKQKGEQMAEYVDLSERVTATFYSDEYEEWTQKTVTIADVLNAVCDDYTVLPSAQPGQRNAIVFQGIVVEYPSISAYPEYEGKPYFSIKYTENGQEFIGYGTYKPEVLSEFLKEYFMSPAQPNLSEAYSKAVFTWLRDYQIRAAELKGRYTPYEVLSWVANDWRKEHERSD